MREIVRFQTRGAYHTGPKAIRVLVEKEMFESIAQSFDVVIPENAAAWLLPVSEERAVALELMGVTECDMTVVIKVP